MAKNALASLGVGFMYEFVNKLVQLVVFLTFIVTDKNIMHDRMTQVVGKL